jgi:hypothetical protein
MSEGGVLDRHDQNFKKYILVTVTIKGLQCF